MSEKLLPCPFCGDDRAYTDHSADCSGGPVVACRDCGAHVLGDTMAEAIALWNKRVRVAND